MVSTSSTDPIRDDDKDTDEEEVASPATKPAPLDDDGDDLGDEVDIHGDAVGIGSRDVDEPEEYFEMDDLDGGD